MFDEVVCGLWLNFGLSPEEVYHMMPFALEKPFDPAAEQREARWRSFESSSKQWLRYLERYSDRVRELSDDDVAPVLKEKRWSGSRAEGVGKRSDDDVTRVLEETRSYEKELELLSKDLRVDARWRGACRRTSTLSSIIKHVINTTSSEALIIVSARSFLLCAHHYRVDTMHSKQTTACKAQQATARRGLCIYVLLTDHADCR